VQVGIFVGDVQAAHAFVPPNVAGLELAAHVGVSGCHYKG
jgi:hypothetical protein